MSKYGNKRTAFMGENFDSIAELNRYLELSLLQKAGKISDLQRQVTFTLIAAFKDERKVDYIADFTYIENGVKIAEDVKSVATAKDKAYIIKRKLFKTRFTDWTFREVIR